MFELGFGISYNSFILKNVRKSTYTEAIRTGRTHANKEKAQITKDTHCFVEAQ